MTAKATKAIKELFAVIEEDELEDYDWDPAIAKIESVPPPTMGQLKKELVGNWKLEFATDEDSKTPLLIGSSQEPNFKFYKGAFMRLQLEDETYKLQMIEVVSNLGPFGNSALQLCGSWTVVDDDVLQWNAAYKVNDKNKEEAIDEEKMDKCEEFCVTHVSDEMLILMWAGSQEHRIIFRRVDDEQVKKDMEEFAVDATQIMGLFDGRLPTLRGIR
mmetsp:Transcript_29841/g.52458  ORF Transcript_29841/g.52458 Transcript_29841/m.52458 type:complete len:216 (-) Transcript_29841:50-697(-)